MRQLDSVVVIGGGVSGLAAAGLLARNGVAVRLFEANAKLGGSCATTTLESFTFNDGAVNLALAGILDHAFARLGLDRVAVLPLRKITANFSTSLPDGTVVTLSEGSDLSVEGRRLDTSRLAGELRRMMEKWEPVLRLLSEEIVIQPYSPWRVLRKGWRHLHKLRGNVASEMRRLVSDEAVRAALSGALLHAGLPPHKMPVIGLVGLIAMMAEGFHLPEGGMGRIPEVLGRALQGHGGEIFLDSKVEKIVVRNGRVRGVEVEGQGRVEAGVVISTASGMSTFGSLLDAGDVPPGMKRRLDKARLSHTAVSLQFGLSNQIEPRGHLNMSVPMMERQEEVFMQGAHEVKSPVYFVPTLTMPELAPPGGSVIEMFHPVRPGIPLEAWDERGQRQLTESAIAALGRRHDLEIVVTRVRSPRDFRDGMRLFRGALYGLSPAVGPREQFPHDPSVDGLYLGGQCTYPGYGIAASAMSGIFAAEAAMKSGRPFRRGWPAAPGERD